MTRTQDNTHPPRRRPVWCNRYKMQPDRRVIPPVVRSISVRNRCSGTWFLMCWVFKRQGSRVTRDLTDVIHALRLFLMSSVL